jgi:hypothetical protein
MKHCDNKRVSQRKKRDGDNQVRDPAGVAVENVADGHRQPLGRSEGDVRDSQPFS